MNRSYLTRLTWPCICLALSSAALFSWAQAPFQRPDPELDLGFDHQLHSAAYYFAEGDLKTASNAVHRALSIVPEDPQAEALRKLIEEMNQQEQEQQQQEQDQKSDSEEDPANQEKSSQDQEQPQDKQEQPPDTQDQDGDQEQQQQQPQQPEAPQPEPNPETQPEADNEAPAQGQEQDRRMTPEEAKILLDALRQVDKMFPLVPNEERSYGNVFRDW